VARFVLDTKPMRPHTCTILSSLAGTSLLIGCASAELPPAPPPETWHPSAPQAETTTASPPSPSPTPLARKPPATRWNADSDNTAELYDCIAPSACPASLEDRAKRRAAQAFGCSVDAIEAKARRTKGLAINPPKMIFNQKGTMQLHVNAPRPGDAFYVSGCGQKALLACVWANRSVHTPEVTYENTEDRVCLWADWADE
jgi:hypothetical protein